ncbi:MAG: hypothetical protein WDN72_02775 [Alphaproteobacteria bacterium]
MTRPVSRLILAGMLGLSACGPLSDTSDAAADNAKQGYSAAVNKWKDVLAYHPKASAQLPQTRYCYQAQSDIVCYDSLQAGNTSHLVGYQDGAQISWVQPGGGSLGYSGAPATSAYPQGGILPLNGSAPAAKASTPPGPVATTVTDSIQVESIPAH